MSSAEPGMQEIERRFVAWADSDARIRAAFVMGSRARTDHPADVWSDLDIVAISAESEHLLNDTEWLAHLGTPLLTFVEPTAVGVGRERRVLFAGGHDVDIAIFSVGQFDHLHPAVIHAVARRGLRVLLDKDRYLARLHVIEAELLAASSSPPASAEWLAVCNNFGITSSGRPGNGAGASSSSPRSAATGT